MRFALAVSAVWLLVCLATGARLPAAALATALSALGVLRSLEGGWAKRPALSLALAHVALYMSTFRWHGGDDIPNSLLPFALLNHGTLALDAVMDPWLTGRELDFTVPGSQGRTLSVYPVLPGLMAVPFYLVTALFDPPVSQGFLHDLSKLSGASITAAAVGVFYLALKDRCSPRWALWLAVLFGSGSWALSVSSQALWQHGPSQLGVALGLWGLAGAGPIRAATAGFGFALSVAARPDSVFLAAAVAGLWLFHRTRELPAFLCGAAVPAAGLSAYWHAYTGRFAPPELKWQARNLGGPQASALVGMLLTPARGLLLYFPPFLVSAWAAVRRRDAETLWLAAGCAGKVLFLSCYSNWVGGLSFGTRYFASMTMIFLWWLTPYEKEIAASARLRRAWACAAAAAFIIHALGGYLRWPGTYETARTLSRLWALSEHPVFHLLDARGGLADWPFALRGLALAALAAGWVALSRRLEKTL
ncbi:MAG: hypothetical protein M0D55_11025 [Elusimicrobiota bacterium]|nr:MAG: hypothetical protein M0D55_11025 [Elusimicrobiota bacterium]